jgi:hypothetical protein
MPSPAYQNMVNLIVRLLTVRFLDVVMFTTLTPLSLLISCKPSFPSAGLKISSLPTLALKSPNKIFIMVFREFIEHILIPRGSFPSHHQFYPVLGHEHSEQ